MRILILSGLSYGGKLWLSLLEERYCLDCTPMHPLRQAFSSVRIRHMCGIVGKLYFTEGREVKREHIQAMSDTLHHRGPDDEGFYMKGSVGLGHRRLSIIDLSPAGHQPMSNEDGTIWIVFNGEIYNFLELRKGLEHGHTFRSHTDTETIVHLYEEYGERCLQYLRGMFAFAIWDEKERKLFVARDRLGKKPLKYYMGKDVFLFASELKAILKDPAVPREVDPEALHHYLTFQYVPNPRTGFQGIRKLPPAHYLTVTFNGKAPEVSEPQQYWKLDYTRTLNLPKEEVQQEILSRFEEAVRMRMVADVPLGAFLSGGIDSSAVVAMMARHSTQPVKTFSIGFPEASHNELPFAKRIADEFHTEHTEFVIEPKALDILPKLVFHYEEPYADSSALPTYYVSKLTRQHVTVALNGDGGDENFAGYPWHVFQKIAARLDRTPRAFRKVVFDLLLAKLPRQLQSTFWRRAAIFARTHRLPRGERYLSYYTSSFFTEEEKWKLYTKAFAAELKGRKSRELYASLYNASGITDPLNEALFTDINSYLPDALLTKVDIASMASSLEARSPFLDHQFMEFAAQIPSDMKMPGYTTKALLRSTLAGILPQEILTAKKRGFMVPVDSWFRSSLRQHVAETLLNPTARIQAYITKAAISRLIEEHVRGKINHGSRLWSLLTLEHWLQMFFPSAP